MFRGFIRAKKIFCVGANKTGTTSLGALLSTLGYNVAPQIPAERMIEEWARRDFHKIIRFCRKYGAFQDIPFSLAFTYQAVDAAFPGSRFILTIRNSPEEWFDSYTRFTRKLLGGKSENLRKNLAEINYNYDGFFLRSLDLIHGKEMPLFDRDAYIRSYIEHNSNVIDYFRHRPGDLLILNLGDSDAASRLGAFLGIAESRISIPHLNSSRS